MSVADIDLLLRGAALGLTVLVALLCARMPKTPARWSTLGLSIAVAAFLLNGLDSAAAWPSILRLSLQLTAIMGVYCFWALGRLLFEDHARTSAWPAATIGLMLCAAALRMVFHAEHPLLARWIFGLGIVLPALSFLLHLLWAVGRDFRDDLLERRRQARLLFIFAGISLAIASLSTPWLFDSTTRVYSGVIQAATYLTAQLILLPTALALNLPSLVRPQQGAISPPTPPAAATEPRDADSVAHAMNVDRLYRETGLSVATLSERLELPEYRLRRAINESLGFRNFSDFLNAWRLKEAAERLRDPTQADTPILTIALDVGYGSIGPFNRAFKARFGRTPSEYRRDIDGASEEQKI